VEKQNNTWKLLEIAWRRGARARGGGGRARRRGALLGGSKKKS